MNEILDNKEKTPTRDERGRVDVTNPENYYYYRFIKNEADKEKCFYSIFEDSKNIDENSVIIASTDKDLKYDPYFNCLLEELKDETKIHQYKYSIERNKDYVLEYHRKFKYYNVNTVKGFPLAKAIPACIYFFNDQQLVIDMPNCDHSHICIIRIFMHTIYSINSLPNRIKKLDNAINLLNLKYCIFEEDFMCIFMHDRVNIDFMGCKFNKNVRFQNIKFNGATNFQNVIFSNNVDFIGATFEESVDFSGSIFYGKSHFYIDKSNNIVFQKKANFNDCKFNRTINFNGIVFSEETDFQRVTFADKAYFMGVKFKGAVNFKDSDFKDKAYFDVETIVETIEDKEKTIYKPTIFYQEVSFEAVSFNKLVSFYGTEFHKNMNFFRTNFKDIANFNNITFQQAFNFANAYINTIKFLGIKLGTEKSSNLSNFKEYFTNIQDTLEHKDKAGHISIEDFRRTCAIVKDSLDNESQKIDANKFYSLELLAHEKEVSKWSKQGLILFLNKWSSNHGQSWLQPLFLILSLGIFAGYLNIFSSELSKFLLVLSTLSGLHAIFIALFITIIALFLFVCAINSYIYQGFFITIIVISWFFGAFINDACFLQGFERAIFPFYTDKDTTFSLINCFGFCYIEHDSNKSIWVDFIINFIKVINLYLLYQLIQAVRLNTRR